MFDPPTLVVRVRGLANPIAATRPQHHAWDSLPDDTIAPLLRSTLELHQLLAGAGILALVVVTGVLVARRRFEGVDRGTGGDRSLRETPTSDRELIHRLLESNGGRMRQTEIVDSVEWSKAKVSRLLADLEESGEITKLRLGRENLICLPGHEPSASRWAGRESGE